MLPIGKIHIFAQNIKDMNIDKLKGFSPKINKRAIEELVGNAPISFFEFSDNDVSNHSLIYTKTGVTSSISARALNRWIEQGVVIINDADKGKIRRFNRLENIWIKIAIELRNFGVSLSNLKYIRKQLFDYRVGDFNMFKFKILKNILYAPEYLVVNEEKEIGFYSYKNYSEKVLKGFLFSHLNIRFIDYICEEFPDNNLNTNFGIKNFDDDVDKLSLLFYLKTNDFQEMRITLSDGDTRLLTNSSELKNNKSLLENIQNWNFKNIQIKVDDESVYRIEG